MDLLTRDVCAKIIRKYLKDEDFLVVETCLQRLGNVHGYMAVAQELKIKFRKEDQEGWASFFVKVFTTSNEFQESVSRELRAFPKECHFYGEVLPELEGSLVSSVFPEFYFTDPDFSRVLVIEDLAVRGFRNNHDLFDRPHCEMTLTALAKMHASSFVLEATRGVSADNLFPDVLRETFYVDSPDACGFKFLAASRATLKGILDAHYSSTPEKYRIRAIKFMEEITRHMQTSKKYKNVLTHGDIWNNNLMFRYDEERNVKEVKLIDLQAVTYRMPATDVLMFLYIVTSRPFIDGNLDTLLRHYHERLSEGLRSVGGEYAWEEFRESVEEIQPSMIGLAFQYVHFVSLPPDEVKRLLDDPTLFEKSWAEDRSPIVLKSIESSPVYRKRIFDLVDQLLECVQSYDDEKFYRMEYF